MEPSKLGSFKEPMVTAEGEENLKREGSLGGGSLLPPGGRQQQAPLSRTSSAT